jgi:plasmid maintenance system antidote protein VapI
MKDQLSIIKGIHPGHIVDRELKKRKIQKRKFASDIHEYPQTISSVLKAKRNMNTSLSLKIENALGWEEGFLMILQVYFDIEQEKINISGKKPDLSKFRPGLFWDTVIESINWQKQKNAIIQRVFERGNELEKEEILRYYGSEAVNKIMSKNDD